MGFFFYFFILYNCGFFRVLFSSDFDSIICYRLLPRRKKINPTKRREKRRVGGNCHQFTLGVMSNIVALFLNLGFDFFLLVIEGDK